MSTSAGKRSSELLQSDEDDASSHGMQASRFGKRARPSHNSRRNTGRPIPRKSADPQQSRLEHVFNSSPGFGSAPHGARPTHYSHEVLDTAYGQGSYQQPSPSRSAYLPYPLLKIETQYPGITIFVGPQTVRFDVLQQQLALHCPLLYTSYTGGNPSEPVILPSANPLTFQKVVTWVQEQRILDLPRYAQSSDPFGMLINLYDMAHDYQMWPLKNECLASIDRMREDSGRVPNVGNLRRIAGVLRNGVHRDEHDALRRMMWVWYGMYYPSGVPGVSEVMSEIA